MPGDLLTRNVNFTGTRQAGLERLEAFVPFAGSAYQSNRNFDFGPDDRSNVSALSPWVRHRLITEEEVCARVLDRFSLSTAEKFIQEVFWRTYWKGWLELRPDVFDRYELTRDTAFEQLNDNEQMKSGYETAVSGQTGIDCFDAWATELVQTGYLHNRARMWFASIWTFTLNLPWMLGADFFYRHLMDGDAASNTLSWRWVAGLQTRGKCYAARASNITKFTDGHFHPTGLNEAPEPLSDAPLDKPGALVNPVSLDPELATFVLITDDDCSLAETLPPDINTVGAATVSTINARSPLPIGKQAKDFNSAALEYAQHAFEKAHGHDAALIDLSNIASAVINSGARQLVMPWATAGTSRKALSPALKTIKAAGLVVVEHRRRWDSNAWPLATKGFFPFRENIPRLLSEAGLDTGSKRR